MILDRSRLLNFMCQERYAVEASVAADGAPQAAIVGVVVSERFEVFFDTLTDSRKTINLRRNPRAALVIGPTTAASERTVQLQGLADEPSGRDLERLLELYFARFPEGRERRQQSGITYWRVRPTWIRYSDFSANPPEIVEFTPVDFT
jgi:uncharacterized protein YhbP (UPF0306 family)